MITVLSLTNSDKASCIRYSFSESAKLVASSNTNIGASFKIALATAIRCFSPPDK